jgi:hypothetical protein
VLRRKIILSVACLAWLGGVWSWCAVAATYGHTFEHSFDGVAHVSWFEKAALGVMQAGDHPLAAWTVFWAPQWLAPLALT